LDTYQRFYGQRSVPLTRAKKHFPYVTSTRERIVITKRLEEILISFTATETNLSSAFIQINETTIRAMSDGIYKLERSMSRKYQISLGLI
jgi:hypothetical protein